MADTKECTVTLADGTHYDLSSLASAKADYEVDVGDSTRQFKLNVCRGVVDELWNVDDTAHVGGYIKGGEHGDFSLGQFTTNVTVSPTGGEPMLIYTDGGKCKGNENELASTAIRFVCDMDEFGAGKPKLVASIPAGDDACHFFFDWPTHVACPANPKNDELQRGHVLLFISFIMVAFLTWFLGHTLYNRFYLGRRGMEQFPLPKCSGPRRLQLPQHNANASQPAEPRAARWNVFKRRSQRAGYNHISADDRAAEDEHLAARFSLDDEDEDAQMLGGEMDAWRRTESERPNGSVGIHQGLVRL